MNKIVYNDCYGGFELSNKAIYEICKRKNIPIFFYKEDTSKGWHKTIFTKMSIEEALSTKEFTAKSYKDYGDTFVRNSPIYDEFNKDFISYPIDSRHDPILVQVVEELGDEASGEYARLRIYETDSDRYRIDEYDGAESVITPEIDNQNYIII